MSGFVLVHGAFRGGWAWDHVSALLQARGHVVLCPTLTGCEADSPRVGGAVALDEWILDVVAAIDTVVSATGEPVILVGHSQAGLALSGAAAHRVAAVERLVYLDAPVPRDGERGVDLNPGGPPPLESVLDPAMWIPARPVGPDQGFEDPSLADWVNERLVPTPLGPSLDPVHVAEQVAAIPTTFAFCSLTPREYPCWSTRSRLDDEGTPYVVLESHHDAPLLRAGEVAALLTHL